MSGGVVSQRTVVLAVDESEMSVNAFDWVLCNYLRKTDHLRIVHVQPYHEVKDVVTSAEMVVPIYSAGKVRDDSMAIAKEYAQKCKTANLKDFKEDIVLEDGSTGSAICSYIDSLQKEGMQDMSLVLGSRELGFFKRAFIGSTSEYCVRHCHCPVIVVKLSQNKV